MNSSGYRKYKASFSRCGSLTKLLARAASLALAVAATPANAADSEQTLLADLSLEELSAIRVVSASKSPQMVSEAPASIFVITESDIRRAGSTTLPEALRLAPNLHVARADAHTYAVSARGFNNVLSNKLLVLIDGRTLYSPLFSGVFWDAQNVLLEDVDRIEVISGPGGTTWGANAVNGIINIITRSADQSQGSLVSVGASTTEQHLAARYGDSLAGDGHYRVYAKHSEHDDTLDADGMSTQSGWQRSQAGFRMDWDNSGDTFTLQGDAYSANVEQRGADDIELLGANLLGRKHWEFSPRSKLTLLTYFDHTQRDQPTALEQHLNTVNLELQHDWVANNIHAFAWGGAYRYARDNINSYERFAFVPDEKNMRWRNVFVQDQIALQNDLRLTLGIKLEENPFTDWESMPSAQLAWTPDNDKLVWSSLSRAVRSPSRIDRDFFAPANPPVIGGVPQYQYAGGEDFESEVVNVFELGYRSQPMRELSWSLTAFYSEYDKLRTLEPDADGVGFVFANQGKADSYGVEMWASWQVKSNWRLHGGLVAQRFDFSLTPGSADISNTTGIANGDPELLALVRSSYDFGEDVKLDSTLRYVDELEAFDVPAYTSLDVNLSWEVAPRMTLSLMGQNLLEDAHPEFGRPPGRGEYERGIYGKLVWRQ